MKRAVDLLLVTIAVAVFVIPATIVALRCFW